MAYNKTTDATAGYISPEHKQMLVELCEIEKRTQRAQLELLIERAYNALPK